MQPSRAYMRQRGDHHIEADLHLAGEQVGDHRRAAAIRDMHHVDAGHLLEQLAGEMRAVPMPNEAMVTLPGLDLT